MSELSDYPTWRVALGITCITFGAVGAAGGGIGGGGLYVPLLLIIIGFDTKEAVPISQACIVGAALAHFLLNVPRRHPVKNIPVIDYGALLTMEPMLLAGALIGVLLNDLLPAVVILIILVVVLTFGTIRTGKRAWQISKNEKKRTLSRAATEEQANGTTSQGGPRGKEVEMTYVGEAERVTGVQHLQKKSTETEAPLKKRGKEFIKWKELGFCLGLWIIVSVMVILRGSTPEDKSLAGIPYCSTGFWLLFLATPVIMFGFAMYFGWQEIQRYNDEQANPTVQEQGAMDETMEDYKEVEWTWKVVLLYSLFSFITGVLAGCLGIGGGLVLSPLLLELGFYPAVASAISGMAVLVTSTSSLLLYALGDKVYWQFAVILLPCCFMSTLIGKIVIDRIAEKYQKQSIIIWSVSIFIFVCFILLTIEGISELVQDPSFEFSNVCDA